MDLHPRLIADLALLTEALQNSSIDLQRLAHQLMSDVEAAVSTTVAVTLTIEIDGDKFDVTGSNVKAGDVASSLRMTLTGHKSARTDMQLTILSETPGALVDIAADMSYALGLGDDAVELDQHVQSSSDSGSDAMELRRTLSAMSEINQAIGILVEGGRSPTEGRAELLRLARVMDTSMIEVARRVLRDAVGWYPPKS